VWDYAIELHVGIKALIDRPSMGWSADAVLVAE
jgi:hypothetical protein